MALPFLEIEMKPEHLQSYGHCWVFQICCHIECSTFRASSFRIRDSSARIPSPLLALFIVMLSRTHLTSQSRISGSRWVTTPSWLSRSPTLQVDSLPSEPPGKPKVNVASHAWLFAAPWTLAHQAPLYMEFSRKPYWHKLPFSSPGDFPDPGIKPGSLALQADSLLSELPGETKL